MRLRVSVSGAAAASVIHTASASRGSVLLHARATAASPTGMLRRSSCCETAPASLRRGSPTAPAAPCDSRRGVCDGRRVSACRRHRTAPTSLSGRWRDKSTRRALHARRAAGTAGARVALQHVQQQLPRFRALQRGCRTAAAAR